eukprot:CAMPEP_0185263478 /NCGR_PEP_ID=MMETSP1359-20130426/15227_1 /TAXON_ID=552665 /ORGANISM="Bigelowiella longifila, Strain CCMP242" /LENGTH=58 /DNA_ID=CAMNT_0027851047 /DNA_START=143 /DNA_END=319 /DNA_ORIENTATION=+
MTMAMEALVPFLIVLQCLVTLTHRIKVELTSTDVATIFLDTLIELGQFEVAVESFACV